MENIISILLLSSTSNYVALRYFKGGTCFDPLFAIWIQPVNIIGRNPVHGSDCVNSLSSFYCMKKYIIVLSACNNHL